MDTTTERNARKWAEEFRGTVAETSEGWTVLWVRGVAVYCMSEAMVRTKGGRKYLPGEHAGFFTGVYHHWKAGTLRIEGTDEFKAIVDRQFARL